MFDPQKLNELIGSISQKTQELQEEEKNKIYGAKSGGGLVSVQINGSGEVIDISIDDSLLEDKESLQILLISALNDAYKNVEEGKKSSMMGAFGGFGDLFGK